MKFEPEKLEKFGYKCASRFINEKMREGNLGLLMKHTTEPLGVEVHLSESNEIVEAYLVIESFSQVGTPTGGKIWVARSNYEKLAEVVGAFTENFIRNKST